MPSWQQRPLAGGLALFLCAFLFPLVVRVPNAEAIPAWARKYHTACTLCHTAWPKLNAYGRDFKINGYRTPEELQKPEDVNDMIDDFLMLDRSFPLTARFVMRPFDKQRDRRARIRSFHEVELMIGGRVGKNVSAWVEAEAEDEEDDFNLFIEQGVMGFHPAQEANVVMGWAPPFWADPFDTLADGGRRMTRSRRGPLDQQFSARERLRSESQFVGFYGRDRSDKVFYLGGVSVGATDPLGGDARDGFARVMVEATTGVYLGGFFLGGTNETRAVDLDFQRTGFDFQIEQGSLSVQGLVLNAKDDLLGGGDESITVGYIEGFYVFQPVEFPIRMIVPLARVDVLDDLTDLTLNLNFYLTENLKVYGEWWQNVDTPAGRRKGTRFTVQVDLAF